jgi:hypothetical protein
MYPLFITSVSVRFQNMTQMNNLNKSLKSGQRTYLIHCEDKHVVQVKPV